MSVLNTELDAELYASGVVHFESARFDRQAKLGHGERRLARLRRLFMSGVTRIFQASSPKFTCIKTKLVEASDTSLSP